MAPVQDIILLMVGLLVVHVVFASFFALRKTGAARTRSVALFAGNYLLLMLFYLPARLLPGGYSPIFYGGFVIGFVLMVRLVGRIGVGGEGGDA